MTYNSGGEGKAASIRHLTKVHQVPHGEREGGKERDRGERPLLTTAEPLQPFSWPALVWVPQK